MAKNNNRANNRANNNASNNRNNNSVKARNNNSVRNNSTRNNNANNTSSASWLIVLVVIVALIGVYFYIQQNRAKEAFTADITVHEEKAMNLVLFYAEWCGHCKQFKPAWDQTVADLNGKTINGVKVNLHSVDCDSEKKLAEEYNVSGFPTIRCITKDENGKNDAAHSYDGARNQEAVTEFINNKTSELNN
jgi:protein disulfide-isomerase-like protein